MKRFFFLLLAAFLLTGCTLGTATDPSDDPIATGNAAESSAPSENPAETETTADPDSTYSPIAVKSPHYSVTKGMMTYFFHNICTQYSEYAAYYGFDASRPLNEQTSGFGSGTWFDLFMGQTRTYVGELLSLCEAALSDGISLTEAEFSSIETTISVLKEEGSTSFDEMLTIRFGGEMTEKDLRTALEITTLAQKYVSEFNNLHPLSTEDCEEYYLANRDSFDYVDLLCCTVNLSAFLPEGYTVYETTEDTDEEENDLILEKAQRASRAYTERLLAAEDSDDFLNITKRYLTNVERLDEAAADRKIKENLLTGKSKTYLPADVAEWAFSAEAGNTTEFRNPNESTEIYYLLTPSYRDESFPRNVRHILFDLKNFESVGEMRAKADVVYAEWEAAGFTEEAFIALCADYSDDSATAAYGGLYEQVTPGYMITEFDEWLFDASRVPGDHGIIESYYGCHIMFYIGEDNLAVWQTAALAALYGEAYNTVIDTHLADLTYFDDVINAIDT